MNPKFYFSLLFGNAISSFLKFSGRGATAAPGLYASQINENLVRDLIERNNIKSIVISGTNGKTTTARIISHLLEDSYEIIHNRQGSNLIRGIASTLIQKSTLTGKINENLAIWESDEAVLPEIVKIIKPQILVLLNLFRDQLDRYGEIETIREKWQKAISHLPKNSTIIANADDPSITSLLREAQQKISFFGIGDKAIALPAISNISDVKLCPVCTHRLIYKTQFTAHLGEYFCQKCGFQRPSLIGYAQKIKFNTDFSSDFMFSFKKTGTAIIIKLPGLFNIYNFLSASIAVSELGISRDLIKAKILSFSGVFGRFQKVTVGDKEIIIFLIKNPTGANEIIRTISKIKNKHILAILNDKIADGKDVSWIWDTSWESLANTKSTFAVSGLRAWDLALRFKYAGIKMDNDDIQESIYYSIRHNLAKLDKNNTLYILPTYTAMLETQKVLSRMGAITKWHKD